MTVKICCTPGAHRVQIDKAVETPRPGLAPFALRRWRLSLTIMHEVEVGVFYKALYLESLDCSSAGEAHAPVAKICARCRSMPRKIPETPSERAFDCLYQAIEATNKRRMNLAVTVRTQSLFLRF